MPIRRPRALDELEAQQAKAKAVAEGASALGGVGMAATIAGPHYAAALGDPDLIPRVAEQWPTLSGATEQARLAAVGEGRPDYSALDVAKAYGLQGLGAVGQGLERSVADLPGGPQVQEGMELAWQKAEQKNVPAALQMGVDLVAPGMHELAMIPAFHGTPHIFDAFRMEKIGTGEGFQAFGHGLYFAENPSIARDYARNLAREANVRIDGEAYVPGDPIHDAALRMYHTKGDKDTAIRHIKDEIAEKRDELRWREDEAWSATPYGDERSWMESVQTDIDNLEIELGEVVNDRAIARKVEAAEGQLYRVELDFDHEDLLDWDVSFSEMPEKVQEQVKTAMNWAGLEPSTSASGRSIYIQLAQAHGTQVAASAALAKAGIPGLRYLDNPSRGRTKATGMRNPDGSKFRPRGQVEIDVSAGATNYGSLDKYIEQTEQTLARYEGAKLSNGMAVSDQALGELEARLNVARRMRTHGQNVGELPLDRNIVAFSDEGIEVLERKTERQSRYEDK